MYMMKKSVTLKYLNTFLINVLAKRIVVVHTKLQLLKLWSQAKENATPILLLGGGSNVLFLENYSGIVLLNRIMGLKIEERPDAWYLHIGAGEVWHNLVKTCLKKNVPGLENLALIPGRVGSAPIQNIGAYGVELCQFCNYVDILKLTTGASQRLSATECQFGYRDSIFKHAFRNNYAVIAVGLKLIKPWQPNLMYSSLAHLDPKRVTPNQIYDTVCQIRRAKLPDPVIQGNAGSFFKNPIISANLAQKLLKHYPDIPYYPQPGGGVKLAAGWLIDRCKLKGFCYKGASVHDKQALVFINSGNATGKDFVILARYVRQKVAERFSIWLEPEVRFIGANGEVDAVKVIA